MSMRRPLILSGLAHDIHAAAARWGLRLAGVEPIWAQTLADGAMTPVSLHCDDDAGIRASGGLGDTIGSIWFRRPRRPHEFAGALPADIPFLRNEWERFVHNVHALAGSLADNFWINPPAAAMDAENKLVQLRAAHRCGLQFPRTLVSFDPAEIRRFVANHGPVVYKPFQTHTWQDTDSGRMYSTYARVVDADMLDDESLRQCPGIYQSLVDKAHDIRVTIIGDRFFPALLSGNGDEVFVDWRVGSLVDGNRPIATTLPAGLEDKLSRLMRELGLVFGCVDLAVDHEGNAHFLEINQAGQFLFLEQDMPELPLLRATCAMLAEGRRAYSLDAFPDARYHDYLTSDEHLEWWDSVKDGIKGSNGQIPGVSLE